MARAETGMLIATALAVGGAALATGDGAAAAGVAIWLVIAVALRARRRHPRAASDPVTALRRWRAVLSLVGAASLVVHVWATTRLAQEGVGVTPALVTTALVVALAAWLAWTQQEIRQRAG